MKWWYLIVCLASAQCKVQNSDYFQRISDRSSQCSDQNNIFLVPGVLSSGNSNRGCLSRFGPATRGSARLQILMPDAGTVSPAVDLPAGDGGCVVFVVPTITKPKVDLNVKVRYSESNCTWESKMTVRVLGTRVFVIQTDRPRYRPGDTLKLRILQLRQDLTPPHAPIEKVWLESPPGIWGDGSRVTEWSRVRTRLGIAQLHYEIDQQPPVGQWTVRVTASDGTQGSANFWVGDYELPPFQLTVRHSAKILRGNDRLVWTVCVRYPWGEAVEGLLVIRLRGAGGSLTEAGVRTVVRTRAPRACHRHAVAAKRVGLNAANPPHVVVAYFSFQEDGTRIWQNTTVVSEVVDKPVSLEFMARHKTVLSAGLPYKLKVKSTRFDDKPASNINITICRTPTNLPSSDPQSLTHPKYKVIYTRTKKMVNGTQTCEEVVTDARGIARMSFTLPLYDTFKYYNFQATITNDTLSETIQLPVSETGSKATLGAVTSDRPTTFIPLYLAMRTDTAITVHFVVITRGSLIYRWGATTQCPSSNTTAEPNYAHKGNYCGSNYYNTVQSYENHNIVSDLKLVNLLRVMIPIKITHQMCPDSHLVAFFYHNGELVSATKHLEFDDCFANKAELTWMTRQVAPKSMATLIITTSVPALCALSALDVNVKNPQNIKQILLDQLKKTIADHRNITAFDASYCNSESDPEQTPSLVRHLSSAGIRSAGGSLSTPQCSGSISAPEPLTASVRTEFNESWLWRLVPVSSNRTAIVTSRVPDSVTRYTTTALCVANNGLALPQSIVIQVFREFFLHIDVPHTLTRGDTTVMTYRLFNYMYETLPVRITISSDSHLRVTSESVVTMCLKQRSSQSRHVELLAMSKGSAYISVRAEVVNSVAVCENYTGIPDFNNSDEVVAAVKILSEGVPKEEHRSALLCGDGRDSPSDISWSWSNDSGIITDTESWKVWAVGDIVGPLLTNADFLTSLPRGCGEQNMARVASNLLALNQLDPSSTSGAVARNHIAIGFSRQMQFAHPSGGFSAFGGTTIPASTWLTAFSVRYLRHAHSSISSAPPPSTILKAESWLLAQQMENGCFRNEGQVFHRELKGAIEDDSEVAAIALTAYVITSLIQGGVTLPTRTLRNSLSCLRALPSTSQSRVYAQALVTYCLLSINDYERNIYKVNEAGYLRDDKDEGLHKDEEVKQLVGLLKMAKRSGNYVWWDTGSLSTSIEATGYSLMALAVCPSRMKANCQSDALGAIRWLSIHRSSQGGFLSTQDTLVALKGLQLWSSILAPAVNLNVSVSSQRSSSQHAVITSSSTQVPKAFTLQPGVQLSVNVQGTGCALVQASRTYHSVSSGAQSDGTLSVHAQTHTDGAFNCNHDNSSCYCAAVIEVCVLWTGGFPDMSLLELRLPGGYSADATLLYSLLTPSNPLLRRIETSAYNNRITMYLGSNLEVSRSGHVCLPVHSVGPKSRTRPAYVTVMDYYAPYINHTQIYTIPEECPARVSHTIHEDIGPDNVFINARSADGEIIITDDFIFQDLPDGIPLEDPLYDYLRDTSNLVTDNKLKDSKNTDDIVRNSLNLSIADNVNFNLVTADNIKVVAENIKNSSKVTADDINDSLNLLTAGNLSDSSSLDTSEKLSDDSESFTTGDLNDIPDNYRDASSLVTGDNIKDTSNLVTSNNLKVSLVVTTDNKEQVNNLKDNIAEKSKDYFMAEEKLNEQDTYLEITTVQFGSPTDSDGIKSCEVDKLKTEITNLQIDDKIELMNIGKDNEESMVEKKLKFLSGNIFQPNEQVSVSNTESSTIIENIDKDNQSFTSDPIAKYVFKSEQNIENIIKNINMVNDTTVRKSLESENKTTNIQNSETTLSILETTTRNNIELYITTSNITKHSNKDDFEYSTELSDQLDNINIIKNIEIRSIHENAYNNKEAEENTKVNNNYTELNTNETNTSTQKQEISSNKKLEENFAVKQNVDLNGGQFSDFHVINSETDLDVPTGIEGPIPSFALPPTNINIGTENGNPSLTPFNQGRHRGYPPASWQPYQYQPRPHYYPKAQQNYRYINYYGPWARG